MMVSMVLGGLYLLIEFPSVQLGLMAEVPLLVLVIYPAIAKPQYTFRIAASGWSSSEGNS